MGFERKRTRTPDKKIAEADYFMSQLLLNLRDTEKFPFYLSAFLNALCSSIEVSALSGTKISEKQLLESTTPLGEWYRQHAPNITSGVLADLRELRNFEAHWAGSPIYVRYFQDHFKVQGGESLEIQVDLNNEEPPKYRIVKAGIEGEWKLIVTGGLEEAWGWFVEEDKKERLITIVSTCKAGLETAKSVLQDWKKIHLTQ